MNARYFPGKKSGFAVGGLRGALHVACALVVTACASGGAYEYDLIPIPVTFNEAVSESVAAESPYKGILYVTDRQPAAPDDRVLYYNYERASALRVGSAKVDYQGEPKTDEELAELANVEPGKKSNFPLSVTAIDEFGYLRRALPTPFLTSENEFGQTPPADDKFVSLINEKLSTSVSGDIYLYVHGFKVVFENPVIVSAQLWHFMNNDGVFMPFAWTATPKRFAYLKDLQTAEISARNLRIFLEFLVENTDVNQVHIIGYSAGTRVVIGALHQFALLQAGDPNASWRGRIGQVTLIGSDYDRQRWISTLADGLLQVLDRLTVYVSPYDGALGLSRTVLGVQTLGKLNADEQLSQTVLDWLMSNERLNFVDVTGVAGTEARGGHSYFQASPWISSDILATLLYGLTPAERGLTREPGALRWSFPDEYDVGLKKIIEKQGSR